MPAQSDTLMTNARCLNSCIPDGMRLAVMIYLLSQLADGSGTGGATCSSPAIKTGTTALAANATRKLAKIRNLSSNPLYVLLGAGCTDTIGGFWEMLPGANAVDEWASSYYVDIEKYTGVITVAGSNLRYVATEIY